MLHIAIVEDEPRMQTELLANISRYAHENAMQYRTTVFSDGDEILEDYQASYDLILLDIQMQRLDGMKTAELIRKLDSDVIIIFVTQMVNYAVKGYAVNALDFLVKPINYPSIERVFRKAAAAIDRKKTQCITIPTGKGLLRLDASKIFYFESFSHKLIVHSVNGEYSLGETMRCMEELFGAYGFFRCNNSYLVNLNYVEKVELNSVIVAGNALTISRPKRKVFMEALANYLGGVKV